MNLGKVVADYGDVLAKASDLGLVRDINSLPHLKSEIRAALKAVLAVTTNATMREHLKMPTSHLLSSNRCPTERCLPSGLGTSGSQRQPQVSCKVSVMSRFRYNSVWRARAKL